MAIDAIKILINLSMKIKLKLNKFFFLSKINKNIALNQDDIVVAIGIIIKPISLKKVILISIFNKTEIREIQNGLLVLCLAKKNVEKTLINENAGNPSAK